VERTITSGRKAGRKQEKKTRRRGLGGGLDERRRSGGFSDVKVFESKEDSVQNRFEYRGIQTGQKERKTGAPSQSGDPQVPIEKKNALESERRSQGKSQKKRSCRLREPRGKRGKARKGGGKGQNRRKKKGGKPKNLQTHDHST